MDYRIGKISQFFNLFKIYNKMTVASGNGELRIRFSELFSIRSQKNQDIASQSVEFIEALLKAHSIEYSRIDNLNSSISFIIDAVGYSVEVWAEGTNFFGFSVRNDKGLVEVLIDNKRFINFETTLPATVRKLKNKQRIIINKIVV